MNKIYIIAEMACSHEGKIALAKKIIDGAGEANADAIQFQIWKLDKLMVPHHPDYTFVESLELSQDEWSELCSYSRNIYPTMQIIACVYEQESVVFAQKLRVDAYKIHSADLSNPGLIKHVATTGKRIDLCVGASTVEETQKAIEWIRHTSSSEIWLMYGYQSFPTPVEAIHLDYMKKLKDLFALPMGYQDHSDAESDAAYFLPAAAIGTGVNILEKHITHDRRLKGADHQSALNPDEFQKFTNMVRLLEAAKGQGIPKSFSEEELKYRKYSKKSIVSSRQLREGAVIGKDDLLFMRASDLGLPPDQVGRLVGKIVKNEIGPYQNVFEDDLQ